MYSKEELHDNELDTQEYVYVISRREKDSFVGGLRSPRTEVILVTGTEVRAMQELDRLTKAHGHSIIPFFNKVRKV